ncbi:MAG: glycosyltransferase family 39 protein, partial [Candidatus Eremiobacteraeota bacterium]|nr:glycosyltransferase family 39 protein [Candidatus Eremiobacteraeota bacterium]
MDVQTRSLGPWGPAAWRVALGLVLLLALVLRLKGIHDPLLDHPGWRQGDTGAIARNFALLQFDILHPQTNYNGPPPNYVELELQIVPFLAATFYKIFGVHEIFGRFISIAFSLGTVAVLAYFGRWLFAGELAGIFSALLFAIMPGSVYYGRTFMPDTAMLFFLTAALYAIARFAVEDEAMGNRALGRSTALLTMAFLAKPVSLAGLIPVGILFAERARAGRTLRWLRLGVLVIVPLALLWAYDRTVASYAEWHWASGITKLHVLPALVASLEHADAFRIKILYLKQMLGVLAVNVCGPFPFAIAIAGLFFLPRVTRSRSLLWGWVAGGLLYTYVVVTVERVDYYMLLLLPPLALAGGAAVARLAGALTASALSRAYKYALAIAGVLILAGAIFQDRSIVAPYYRYNPQVYRNAIALDATLPAG